MNWLSRLMPRRIAGRLLLWFLVLGLLPSIILLLIQSVIARGALEEVIGRHLRLLLHTRIRQVDTYAAERLREIDLLAQAPVVAQAVEDFRKAVPGNPEAKSLSELNAKYRPIFERFRESLQFPNILLLSPDGTVLFRLQAGFEPGENLLKGPFEKTALGEALRACLKTAPPQLAAPDFYPTTGDETSKMFTMQTIGPIEKPLGVIVLQVDPKVLIAMFRDYEGLGRTGDSKLARRFGNQFVVLNPLRDDPSATLQHRRLDLGDKWATALQAAVQKQQGFGRSLDWRGRDVIAAWGYTPSLDVGVVTKIDHEEAYGAIDRLWQISLGLLAGSTLLILPLALWVARSFTRPISDSASAMERIAQGDLTAEPPRTRRLATEIQTLVDSVDRMSRHLRSLIKHIQESIVTAMSTSAQIGTVARQQESTIQEHGSATVEVAAAVNEISATSNELSRTIADVHTAAVHAGDLATAGQAALTGMHNAMAGLAESTGSIGARLSVISERAGNINLAVTTITKVADQTNLLSINAAIEAEKAGESGRGFLVVAREIRRLADQTAVATLEIDRIVKEMQQSVTAGVMEMDKFNEQVRHGVDEVGQIEHTLGDVIGAVQNLLPRFQQVADGMSAQSQGADQIREAMAHLSEGATRTTQSIREFHNATQQLRDSIGKLQADVTKFRT
jgi:methyl-accepting chemotaxis protein WspA